MRAPKVVLVLFCALLSPPAAADTVQRQFGPPLSRADAIKAKRSLPRESSPVVADTKGSVAPVLNEWLHENVPKENLRPCESFSNIQELNDILASLVNNAHPVFQEIYASKCKSPTGCDKRGMRYGSIEQFDVEWQEELNLMHLHGNTVVKEAVMEVLRNGKCYEAVMLFFHHLSEQSRTEAFENDGLVLPFLPKDREAINFLVALYRHGKTHDGSQDGGEERHRSLQDDLLVPQDGVHSHYWTELMILERQRLMNETLSNLEFEIIEELLAKFNTQSPCEMAHRKIASPWSEETAEQAGVSPEVAAEIAKDLQEDTFNTFNVSNPIPNTTVPGAGYVSCDEAAKCLEGGDVQYMIQAVVRAYVVPGSGKIFPAHSNMSLGEDVVFHTRSFEAMPGSPSAFGPDAAGGDGTGGLLGPAIVANPGDAVHIFVKNNLADTSALGPAVPTAQDYWNRIQVINNVPNGTQRLDFAWDIPYNGPEWRQNEYPLKDSDPVPPENMTAGVGEQNVPGLETNGYDIFNIHMHGWETQPHLFYPPGTSDPSADWISISPDEASGQQCMCYRLNLAESNSRGDYLYHTHRHGTTTMLTWSGMFGLSLTGEENVTQARENPSSPPTLTQNLVEIADAESLEFDDDDVNFVVIYDSTWMYANMTTEDNKTQVVVSDFISGERGNIPLHPFFVNNEFQPTIQARTGALTVFRIACVSAGNICAFEILEGEGTSNTSTIIPFDRVASDGITYQKPVYRQGNGNPLVPDITATEAYLSMGGGMREVITVQFPKAGKYTVWQRANAFDDSVEQLLMTIEVTGQDAEAKSIDGYTLSSARPPINPNRNVSEYRGMTFGTQYDQEVYPFPYYGIGNINGVSNSTYAYNLTNFDIGAIGGTCGIWIIRTMDVMLHPFHIHVNPFMVLNSTAHYDINKDLKFVVQDYTPPFDTVNGTALAGIWRDTAFVPPYGYLVIKQCYDAGVRPSLGGDIETFGGKFVFHCHFLVHEDTGLIRNMILASESLENETAAPSTSSGATTRFAVTSIVLAVLFGLLTYGLAF